MTAAEGSHIDHQLVLQSHPEKSRWPPNALPCAPRSFVARSGRGTSNEQDFQTSRNVCLRGTPIGPDAARRQPTRTWHCYLACALHTDPPGPLRACTCRTNPALAPNARAPADQTRATRLTTGHKSIPARPGYAPSHPAARPAPCICRHHRSWFSACQMVVPSHPPPPSQTV
jgi:hypothetical protein